LTPAAGTFLKLMGDSVTEPTFWSGNGRDGTAGRRTTGSGRRVTAGELSPIGNVNTIAPGGTFFLGIISSPSHFCDSPRKPPL
jgi:hypothetical protein